MRLASIELRNYRCFENVEIDLRETTIVVGANDTGKSAILEAIHWLLDPAEIEWQEAEPQYSTGAVGTQVIGRLVDLSPEAKKLTPFLDDDGGVRIGIAASTDVVQSLVIPEERLQGLLALLDQNGIAEWLSPGQQFAMIVDPGHGRSREAWIPWWVWQFPLGEIEWGVLDKWDGGVEFLRAIRLGGSEDASWDPMAVLRPIVARQIGGELDNEVQEAIQVVEDRFDELLDRVSAAHSAALAKTSGYRWVRWHSESGLADQLADGVVSDLAEDPEGPEELRGVNTESTGRNRRIQLRLALARAPTTTLALLGPGSQRQVALAALDLYRDPLLWPLGGSVVLLVEEPEAGLHPEAQRRAASLIHGLATYGLQVVVVTHSPIFINASSPDGIRLARKDRVGAEVKRSVVRPRHLAEVREELDLRPSDILLARRFVVVEGESDRLILGAWARTAGADLAGSQIQVIPSGGYSSAERVAQFVTLAYEGADFVVVLDNGAQAPKTRSELEVRFGPLVDVILLSRTDVEGFFHPSAVVAWLRVHGHINEELGDIVDRRLGEAKGGRLNALGNLAKDYLGRQYEKTMDGLAIASLTLEQQIDPEIRGLLNLLVRE